MWCTVNVSVALHVIVNGFAAFCSIHLSTQARPSDPSSKKDLKSVGASIMAACDLVVGARDAYASVAYIKIGLTPDGGSTAFFGTALPRQMVAEMMFTGDRIPLTRLYDMGVVNKLAGPGGALDMAMDWATQIAAGPSRALAKAKEMINSARLAPLQEQLDLEADNIAEAIGGDEGGEGLAAFLGKRKPDWDKTR